MSYQDQSRTTDSDELDELLMPAQCSLQVTDNSVACTVRAGYDLEDVVSAAHQEARWALDRGDVLIEQYDIVNVKP